MNTKASRFIKYPMYHSPLSLWEKLMIRVGRGAIAECCVCGAAALSVVEGVNLRETCVCAKCGSTNRQRQIAYVSCHAVGHDRRKRIPSLKHLSKLDELAVYNTEASGPIHDQLSKMKEYVCSEYFGSSYISGDLVGGTMHQDLTDLSLGDESIDLVLSSDVFEHVPQPYKAHEQVYGILKSGGRHVFTVPFYQTEYLDETRAVIDARGNTVLLKEPIYHLDPIRPEGTLVYRIFALEMLVRLRRIGFKTNLYHLYSLYHGILGPNAIVFEAIKD
jgi:SAM-dependent methyltransferase